MADGASMFGWELLVLSGLMTGFCSGMLGIGGGLVTVPALMFCLPLLGISGPEVPRIAMATSLVVVIPTSIASIQAHSARGTLDWQMWAIMAPGIVMGSLLASIFAVGINISLATLVFVAFALSSALRLLREGTAVPPTTLVAGPEPSLVGIVVRGIGGGALSSLLGLGAAFFAIPTLTRFIALPQAIGTAGALALPMAIGGTAGYLLAASPAGCGDCTGYVFLPAVAALGMTAVLAAPFGARLTSVLPVVMLRRMFAVLLIGGALAVLSKKLPDILIEARALIHLPRISVAFGSAPAVAPEWIGKRSLPLSVRLASRYGPRRGFAGVANGRPPMPMAGSLDVWRTTALAANLTTNAVPMPDRKTSRAATRRSPPTAPKPRRTAEAPVSTDADGPKAAPPSANSAPDILKTLFGK